MIYYETILSSVSNVPKNILESFNDTGSNTWNKFYSSKFFSLINLFEYSLPISSIRSLHVAFCISRTSYRRREQLLEAGASGR